MNFAIIVPTRGRVESLQRLMASIEDTTDQPENLNIWIGCDGDDVQTKAICRSLLATKTPSVNAIVFKPSEWLHRDYVNILAQHAIDHGADFVWVLGDDTRIVTKHWDTILHEKIQAVIKPDGVLYIGVEDSTPQPTAFQNLPAPPYTCFPILSKQAVEAVGFFMHPTLKSWGADITLFHLYSHELVNRVLGIPEVVLAHESMHNGSKQMDGTSKTMEARYMTQAMEPERIIRDDIPTEALMLRQFIEGKR